MTHDVEQRIKHFRTVDCALHTVPLLWLLKVWLRFSLIQSIPSNGRYKNTATWKLINTQSFYKGTIYSSIFHTTYDHFILTLPLYMVNSIRIPCCSHTHQRYIVYISSHMNALQSPVDEIKNGNFIEYILCLIGFYWKIWRIWTIESFYLNKKFNWIVMRMFAFVMDEEQNRETRLLTLLLFPLSVTRLGYLLYYSNCEGVNEWFVKYNNNWITTTEYHWPEY